MNYGKKICRQLKAIRKKIADANGISYSPSKCNHRGDCAGTCPACDAELRFIEVVHLIFLYLIVLQTYKKSNYTKVTHG